MTLVTPWTRAAARERRFNLAWAPTMPRWSLARQYLVASLLVVLSGVVITGAWVGHQIESSVLQRTAGITALYVDSVVSPNLQALAGDDRWLTANDTAALNRLLLVHGLGPGGGVFQ